MSEEIDPPNWLVDKLSISVRVGKQERERERERENDERKHDIRWYWLVSTHSLTKRGKKKVHTQMSQLVEFCGETSIPMVV